jgi:SPP1 gp7 family putative phage head morphogenesis protein
MNKISFIDARRDTQRQRAAWESVRRTERYYAAQLKKVADQIESIVRAFGADDPQRLDEMIGTLQRYADILRPWARSVARRLLYEVARRDERAWRTYARLMGEAIEQEIASAPIGHVYQSLMESQVDLITSIPRDAAARVHAMATSHLYEGRRYPEMVDMIMQSGAVAKSRAVLIARTETARAAANFMQVRAEHIGSESYTWRTSRDRRVRPRHRKLEAKVFRWDEPPIIGENGERGHPGTIYNCRCIAEPILPARYT